MLLKIKIKEQFYKVRKERPSVMHVHNRYFLIEEITGSL